MFGTNEGAGIFEKTDLSLFREEIWMDEKESPISTSRC
jgi:hypothetical protein